MFLLVSCEQLLAKKCFGPKYESNEHRATERRTHLVCECFVGIPSTVVQCIYISSEYSVTIFFYAFMFNTFHPLFYAFISYFFLLLLYFCHLLLCVCFFLSSLLLLCFLLSSSSFYIYLFIFFTSSSFSLMLSLQKWHLLNIHSQWMLRRTILDSLLFTLGFVSKSNK